MKEFERILREEANVFDDGQCHSIKAQVLGLPRSATPFPETAYFKWKYFSPPQTLLDALQKIGVYTRDTLRDKLNYVFEENRKKFEAALVVAGVSHQMAGHRMLGC